MEKTLIEITKAIHKIQLKEAHKSLDYGWFTCKKQKKKKAKFCGEKDYKFLCSKLNKKTHRKR